MSPLERAARAGCKAGGIDPDAVIMFRDEAGINQRVNWEVHMPLYRAALEALMEPSEEIYAGARSVDIVRACGEGIETHHLVRCPEEGIDEVRDMWQAMLCEVLKDKP